MARTRKTVKGTKPLRRGGTWGRIAFAVLVTLAVLALAFFLVIRDQGRTSVAENMVGSVFAPLERAFSTSTRFIRDTVQGAKDYLQMTKDYEAAKQEIVGLQLQLQALNEEARENERLRDLLDAHERYESHDPVFAHVIARDAGVWFDTFTIDVGTKDGIQVNMPVMTGDGLVGRVYEVGLMYAKVLSIIDTRSNIGCLIERTRNEGTLRGRIEADSQTAECNMYYLPAVNVIIPGDVVLTSGTDEMFPKGLMVGTVASVSRQSDLSDRYIVVLPAVDFLHIEEVLVLRTLVERDAERLPPLPTPTPKPTPEPTPTPLPDENSAFLDDQAEPNWIDPLTQFDGGETFGDEDEGGPTPSPTPRPTFDPNTQLPEDQWAM